MTELESDVVVEVGEVSFYLHKVSRCILALMLLHPCIDRSLLAG